MRPFRLYKIHNDLKCNKLLWITRYLYSIDINVRPKSIQERLFPAKITEFPAIELSANGVVICGYDSIINYYQHQFEIEDLENKMNEFQKRNPDYRISDN